jgi:hypothetical protein
LNLEIDLVDQRAQIFDMGVEGAGSVGGQGGAGPWPLAGEVLGEAEISPGALN